MAGEFLRVNCQSKTFGSFRVRFSSLRSSQANRLSRVEFLESKEGRLGEANTPKCCFLSVKLVDFMRPKFDALIGNLRTSQATTYLLRLLPVSVCHMQQSDLEVRSCSSWDLSARK